MTENLEIFWKLNKPKEVAALVTAVLHQSSVNGGDPDAFGGALDAWARWIRCMASPRSMDTTAIDCVRAKRLTVHMHVLKSGRGGSNGMHGQANRPYTTPAMHDLRARRGTTAHRRT